MKCVAMAVLWVVVGAVSALAVPIRVVDEAGEPVSAFDILVLTPGATGEAWASSSDGKAEVGEEAVRDAVIDVAIRSPDFAPFSQQFDGEAKAKLLSGDEAIKLVRGEEVRLRLKPAEGVTLPADLQPIVYLQSAGQRRMMMWAPKTAEQAKTDPQILSLKAVGDGEYVLHLAKETRPIFVSIHAPGFLRFFETGPFTLDDVKEGVLEVEVPAPATVKSGLVIDDAGEAVPFEKVEFSLLGMNPRHRSYFMVSTETKSSAEAGSFEVKELPPGTYIFSLRTSGAEGEAPSDENAIDPAQFNDRQQLMLQSGETEDATVQYVPYDQNVFRGAQNAAVSVLTQAGTPAAGKKVKITFNDRHYGAHTVLDGVVPADGIVKLEGVSDAGPFLIEVNEERLGLIEIKPTGELQEFEFRLAPGVGDPAPDIEFTDVRTNETRRLADFAGKPVFLEFWATWCGPCQAPLAKVNGLIPAHEDWSGKIEFLPLSIDDEIGSVAPHLESKGWTNLPQFWTGAEGAVGFNAPAVKTYVVRGIPNAMLIDSQGTIVWRGHPMSIDLAAKINELLGIEDEGESSSEQGAAEAPSAAGAAP